METSKNNIGEIIRKHRELKDISQDALGDIIGKSQQTIHRYENNITIPPKNVWNHICKTLDIPLGSYFNEETSNSEFVSETKNQTYIDKPLKEMTDLVINQREFLDKIGFTEFLKSIPEMTDEDKKLYIPTIKNIFKLIKRSNKNGS